MRPKQYKVLDECLARVKGGETPGACLDDYPRLRQQLEPLLLAAASVSAVPAASASNDFRRRSKHLLMTRLHRDSAKNTRPLPVESASNVLSNLWRILERAITGPAKVAVPITLALVFILQGVLIINSAFFFPASVPEFTSQCTLTTFDHGVLMKRSGATIWERAENGTTLKAGARIQLASSSNAILTFFNGTTVELEPGADLVVEQLEVGGQNQPTVIVLRQWFGKTWSRVAQLADPGSRYEIQTPSATIMVRGTVFTTEVDITGTARVQTIEGLVSVSAQGEEVYLPAGQQTEVESGASPLKPVPISAANDTWSPAQFREKPPMQGSRMSAAADSLPGTADSSAATRDGTLTGAPQEQKIEALPAQTSNNEDTPSQSQEGLPSYGKDGGQGQRELWIPVISGVVLLLWIGVFITMERRKSATTKHRKNKFSSTRYGR